MPQIAITEPRLCGGYMSSITAWLRGPSAAPKQPWIRRNSTISFNDWAAPQAMDAIVKPATQVMRKFFLPNRADIQPTGAVMIAAAIMEEVSTQVIWSRDAARLPSM